MAGIHLQQGSMIDLHGRRYTCGARGPGGAYLFTPHEGRASRYLKPEALFDLVVTGSLKIVEDAGEAAADELSPSLQIDTSVLEPAERDRVLMRAYYMRRLEAHRKDGGTLSNNALEAFAAKVHTDYTVQCKKAERQAPAAPMSPASIRRWFRSWVETGGTTVALARDARGNSHSKLTSEQQAFIEQAIAEDYLNKRRVTIRHAHKLLTARINVENRQRARDGRDEIPIPHYNTLRRHIAQLDLYDVLRARHNAAYALKVTRRYGTTPPTHRHLESVQADHTLLDIYVDFGQGILFRPWLTLIMDRFSRAILGFWLTPDPPSGESVMQALRMAVMTKDVVALGGDSNWPWAMHGLPLELILDNGKDFHSLDVEAAAADLGITLSFAPPRKPWWKAHVERKFGEVNAGLLSSLPGQVFKYEPQNHGLDYPHLTLDELRRLLVQWITTVLHRTPNKEGHTPEELWLNSVQQHGTPGGGFSVDYINSCVSKFGGEQPIHSNGVHFNSTHYYNDWLGRLRNRLAPKDGGKQPPVRFKWSAHDIGFIWVFDAEARSYMKVESTDETLHGRSLYNHRVVLREQRNRRHAKMSDDTYTDAELALDSSVKDLVAGKKAKTSKSNTRLVRFLSGMPEPPKPRGKSPGSPQRPAPDEPVATFGEDLDATPAASPNASAFPTIPPPMDSAMPFSDGLDF